MSFIKRLLDYAKDAESPTSFWKWAGYATIAALLRDHLYWYNKTRKTVPNLYVVLVADSGAHRKGTPIDVSHFLVSKFKGYSTLRGRMSPQGLLEHLSKVENKNGLMLTGGTTFICSDELSGSFVKDDGALVPILTDIYEYRESFPYTLRTASFVVKNLCVNLLGASNETLLKHIYTDEALYGGLLARTFIISPDETRPSNSMWSDMEKTKEEMESALKPLIDELTPIISLKGKVLFTPEAQLFYDEWYKRLRESYINKPDKTGVLARLHTGVLKLALIIAVDETKKAEVTEKHIEKAIDECIALLKGYELLVMKSTADRSQIGGLFLSDLYDHAGTITRAEFIRRHFLEVTTDLLDEVTNKFQQAGLITAQAGFDGTITYIITGKGREIFERNLKKP